MRHRPRPRRRAALSLALLLAPLALACRAAGPAAPPRGAADEAPLAVGVLVVDGVYDTELTAPVDVFHHTVFHTRPGMRVFTVAPSRAVVTTFEGLRLLPDETFASAPPIDVLVVPSAEHSMDTDLEDARMIDWVRATGARARFVLSLCDGAFVLARAGLLDGHEATTFPADRARLREMFPGLVVHDDASFVHDGRVITSVGGAPSFDAALYLCELLYGKAAADGIAAGMVIDWDLARVPHRVVPGAAGVQPWAARAPHATVLP